MSNKDHFQSNTRTNQA